EDALAFVGMDALGPPGRVDPGVGGRETEDLYAVAPPHDAGGEVQVPHRVVGGPAHEPEALLADAQGFASPLALGDVPVVDDDGSHRRLVQPVGGGALQVQPLAVLA